MMLINSQTLHRDTIPDFDRARCRVIQAWTGKSAIAKDLGVSFREHEIILAFIMDLSTPLCTTYDFCWTLDSRNVISQISELSTFVLDNVASWAGDLLNPCQCIGLLNVLSSIGVERKSTPSLPGMFAANVTVKSVFRKSGHKMPILTFVRANPQTSKAKNLSSQCCQPGVCCVLLQYYGVTHIPIAQMKTTGSFHIQPQFTQSNRERQRRVGFDMDAQLDPV
jgi:hypothetical protein